MPSFSNNPERLTKERLKSALIANGVPLPQTDQRKAFYVDLYLQKLSSQNDEEEFSSDESEEVSESSPIGYSKKLPPKQKIVINKRVKTGLPFDVTALSDGDLARQLKSFGATVGPMTDSTRPLYQKKLAKLLAEELKAPPAPVVHSKLSPKQKTKQSRTTPKSQRYEDFSDGNETADAEDMEIEEVEGLQYNNHFEQEDPEDPELVKLPSPSFKSTPAESAFRKRVTINIAKQEFTGEVGIDSKHETVSGLDKTDSAGKEEGREQTEPTKEDSSMVGAHIRFVLAILLFLGFMIFLVYILMEGTPQGARAPKVP